MKIGLTFAALTGSPTARFVEHWDVLEPSIPREQWKNANGKF